MIRPDPATDPNQVNVFPPEGLTAYHPLLVFDIKGSSTMADELRGRLQNEAFALIRQVLHTAGVDTSGLALCERGDGALIVLPASTSKSAVTDACLHTLDVRLRRLAAQFSDEARLRLRVSLHAGDISPTPQGGWLGTPVDTTFRLAEAGRVKAALAKEPEALMVLVVSDTWFADAVKPARGTADPSQFERFTFSSHSQSFTAWMAVPAAQRPIPGPRPKPKKPKKPPSKGPDGPHGRSPKRWHGHPKLGPLLGAVAVILVVLVTAYFTSPDREIPDPDLGPTTQPSVSASASASASASPSVSAPAPAPASASGGGTIRSVVADGVANSHDARSGSSGTPPTSASTTTPPTTGTRAETVGSVTHTWTDYSDAGGEQGPNIPALTTVQVSCKVQGFKVADGDTWWYRISGGGWADQYYASADAFYNDGATSGSLQGTPSVDGNVPDC